MEIFISKQISLMTIMCQHQISNIHVYIFSYQLFNQHSNILFDELAIPRRRQGNGSKTKTEAQDKFKWKQCYGNKSHHVIFMFSTYHKKCRGSKITT